VKKEKPVKKPVKIVDVRSNSLYEGLLGRILVTKMSIGWIQGRSS
jgi:hypothetical protein